MGKQVENICKGEFECPMTEFNLDKEAAVDRVVKEHGKVQESIDYTKELKELFIWGF